MTKQQVVEVLDKTFDKNLDDFYWNITTTAWTDTDGLRTRYGRTDTDGLRTRYGRTRYGRYGYGRYGYGQDTDTDRQTR